jgi:cyclophilin family peptidyl-prolyl cis-trans isomerase
VRRPLALICSTFLLAGAAGCGSDSKKVPGADAKGKTATQTTATAAAKPAPAPAQPPRCSKVSATGSKGPRRVPAPKVKLNPERSYDAVFSTSCGRFTLALEVKRSPKTVASFVNLARHRFYDGLTFHRVVHGFVIQGGDPKGNGSGGPGYSVVEAPPSDVRYTKGVVAMAKTELEDPGTSGSQFYVVTADDAQLPPDYALLGKVSTGQAVVDVIGLVPTDDTSPDPRRHEQPVDPVVIRSVRIVERKR